MKLNIRFAILLFKLDLILSYFLNLGIDIFDPICPFGYLRAISYSGSGLALVFSLILKI